MPGNNEGILMNALQLFNLHIQTIKYAESCKILVQYLDEEWRANKFDFEIVPDQWIEISAKIAEFKGKRMIPPEVKRYWRISLKTGENCTMIIEDPCSYEEALQHARDRFFNNVLIVDLL